METTSMGHSGPNPVAEEQFRRGFQKAKEGDLDEAILAVEAAIAVAPEEGRYHDLMGTLYAKKGLYDMAVAEWKRSIECDPDHAEVFRRIETAQKMQTQSESKGEQWAWIAISMLAACFVVSLAWGAYQMRAKRAQGDEVIAAQDLQRRLETDYVDREEFETASNARDQAIARNQVLSASLDQTGQELDEIKKSGNFVSVEELKVERERRNQVESQLADERRKIAALERKIGAIGDATGAEAFARDLEQKEDQIRVISENYEKMNEERKRLDQELSQSRGTVAQLEGLVDDLQRQVAEAKAAVTSSGPSPRSDSTVQETASLLNQTLEAVRFAADGKTSEAREVLKLVERKAPPGSEVAKTLEELGGAKVLPATDISAKPTPSPVVAAAPSPTPPKPTPKATARPKPTPVPTKPPQTTVADRGPVEPAKPRPIRGRDTSTAQEPAEPRSQPRSAAASSDAERLYEQKKTLTHRAYGLYKERRFEEARRYIDQAHRIDSNDRAVNQLRGAIYQNLPR